jgi:Na+-driven multidrug efflux pump
LGNEERKSRQAESAAWIAVRYNVFFLSAIGLLFTVFAGPIARFFTIDTETMAYGTQALWIIGLGFPFYAAGICLTSAFNGAGDTWTPTLLNLCCFWLFQIPLAWILANHFGAGATGVFIVIPIAFSMPAIRSVILA